MIHGSDIKLFRGINPRKGLLMKRWGPRDAAWIDRLTQAGLIQWASEGERRQDIGIRLVLTAKGRVVFAKQTG